MSTIKKYLKQILFVVGFLLLALVFAFNPTLSANAATTELATQTLNNAVSAVHLPTKLVDLADKESSNKSIVIPLLNFTGTTASSVQEYTIRVTDPSGRTHDLLVDSSNTADPTGYFTYDASPAYDNVKTVSVSSLTNGRYSITYIYQNAGKTIYSYPFSVEVKGVNYELSFVEPKVEGSKISGSKILLPATAGNNQTIVIPDAYVKIAGTDDYLLAEENKVLASLTVEKDNAVIYSSTAEHNTSTEVAKIVNPNSNYNGKLQLTTNLGDEESVTYRFIYKYVGGNNIPTKIFTINVTKDYKAPKTLTINSTELPAMQLGQKGITLPEWTASTETVANVETNITKIVIEKEGNSSIKYELPANERTFDFTKENFGAQSYKEMVGNYNITYYMESAYGDADNKLSASLKKTVYGVTDKTIPDVYMSYSYDIENGEWKIVDNTDGTISEVLTPDAEKTLGDVKIETKEDEDGNTVPNVNTDYAVELKANYGYGELVFPAIYAEDLVNSYDEFVFYRYFQRNNDINEKYYIDNIMLDDNNNFVKVDSSNRGYNASGDQNIGKFNRVVRFKFNATDDTGIEYFTNRDYTLYYYVVNKEDASRIEKQENYVYESGKTAYSFKVLNRVAVGKTSGEETASDEGVSTPTIKINDLINNSSIDKDATLNITVESKDSLDKRLKNAVFYYTGEAKSNVKSDLETALSELLLTDTWGDYTSEDGEIDYFTTFKCNVLENEDASNGLVAKMTAADYTNFTRFDSLSNDNFETKLNLTDFSNLNIVAVTINDNNTIAIATKTLKVNNTDETKAPVASEPVEGKITLEAKYNQGDSVTLPKVSFTDDDKSLSAFVKYYVLTAEDDEKLSSAEDKTIPTIAYNTPKNVVYTQSATETTISDAKIVTNKVGTYYVIYTAIDDAGNQTFVSYNFEVEDNSLPSLSVNAKGDGIEKSGTSIKAETNTIITFEPTVTKAGEDLTDDSQVTYKIESVGKKYGYTASPAGSYNALLFEEADEYLVTISAQYKGEDLEKQVFYVTISNPELTWDFDIEIQNKADIGEVINLPNLTASYGKSKLPVPVTVTVKDPDNKTPEWGDAKKDETTGYWTFKFNGGTLLEQPADKTRTQKGTYKVTYTATWNGTTITKSFDIKVGDSIPPEFRFANDVSALEQDIVYEDGNTIEYTIDLTRYSTSDKNKGLVIKVKNGDKQIYEIDTGLSIYDKDGTIKTDGTVNNNLFSSWSNLKVELKTADGKLEEITDSDFEKQYKITGVGKYTLVLTMTDYYNNTSTREFSFNVVAKTEPKENNDNVVGIVLIVVSLVILAGVILFFAFTGKKGGSNKTKSTKTNKKVAETTTETDTKSGDVE